MQVGWFLHTPFPSSEIYRTLPVREEVLRAVLKADLIGFHTYDYARHFVSACTRILGLEVHLTFLDLPAACYTSSALDIDQPCSLVSHQLSNLPLACSRLHTCLVVNSDLLHAMTEAALVLSGAAGCNVGACAVHMWCKFIFACLIVPACSTVITLENHCLFMLKLS